MIKDLKPYPAYKDSGVEWLGKVPKDWKVRRLGGCVSINLRTLAEATPANFEFNYLDISSVGTGRLVTEPARTRFGSAPSRARRIVHPGDTLVSTVRTYLKATWCAAVFDGPLICSTGFAVLTPSVADSPPFWGYVAQSEPFTRAVVAESVGVAYPAISDERFKALRTVLPPSTEQAAIAHFLDHVDSRIQRFIAAKERLIELLEEEKQAVIHHAVTCGLDPDVPFKPSGVDWLGDIPEHWDTVALRRITTSRCDGPFGSRLTSAHYVDHGVRVVRLQNIAPYGFQNGNRAFISEAHYSTLGDHDVIAGDVLIAGLGDDKRYVGRACVAPSEIEPAMVKADCFRFRLRPPQYPPFVARQLSATARLIAGQARGSTRQRINLGDMGTRPLALPPIQEQHAIGDFLKQVDSKAHVVIEAAEREIDFLREYRTRLISDLVTGKLDVREAAEWLPDDPGATDPALDEQLEEAIT